MNQLNDEMYDAADEQPSEESCWIERLTDASSDYESIGAEAAAGLGL